MNKKTINKFNDNIEDYMSYPKYKECESFLHKKAKEVLKEWLEGAKKESSGWQVLLPFSYRTNRDSGIFLEYPIVVNKDINSITNNWDEIWSGPENTHICEDGNKYLTMNEFVPTFNKCVEKKLYPIAIIDLVISHKGCPKYFIEICHKHPVSDDKINKLKKVGINDLYEISATWILNQIKRPTEIKFKKIINDNDRSRFLLEFFK